MHSDEGIADLVRRAPVVIVRSPLTDLGPLAPLAARLGDRCQEVEFGMGSAEDRAAFRRLQQQVGHRTLPMVFIDGRFVGGLEAAGQLRSQAGAPTAALLCGYGGLLPFAAGALAVVLAGVEPWAFLLLAYAAVILTFVGALHWGLTVAGDAPASRYGASVVPGLVAWGALALPVSSGLAVVAAALLLWWALERRFWSATLPPWFRRLRAHLTSGGVVALLVGALGAWGG
ncbi:MAG: DUF3429 family protein [Arhodomonas sp.]|nr:DUF3429 family protein [Arhodomonas sp.]